MGFIKFWLCYSGQALSTSLILGYYPELLKAIGTSLDTQQKIIGFTMQPLLNSINKLFSEIALKKTSYVSEENLLPVCKLFDALNEGFKNSFWLVLDPSTFVYWYNTIMYVVLTVNQRTSIVSNMLKKCVHFTKIGRKLWKDKPASDLQKIRKGASLFTWLFIFYIFFERTLELPITGDTIGYDYINWRYGSQNGYDFRDIYSMKRLGIATSWCLFTALISVVVHAKFKCNTMKLKIIPRNTLMDKIALFIVGQLLLINYSMGIELAFFTNNMVDRSYWEHNGRFY